jgi:hypothetical protein
MKKYLTICFLLAVITSQAQKFTIDGATITVIADTMTVKKAFEFTDLLLTGKMKIYDRYVIKNDTTYYRAGIGIFRKPPIYIIKNGVKTKAKLKNK